MLSRLARDGGVPVAYVNLVGGNDELVFDGGSMALDGRGRVRARAALFAEDFVVVDLETTGLYTKDRVVEIAIIELDDECLPTSHWSLISG